MLTQHGNRNKSLNATFMGEQLSNLENPDMLSMFNGLLSFSQSEVEDPDLLEIKELLGSILHEDLNIDGPFDMLSFGMKVVAQ